MHTCWDMCFGGDLRLPQCLLVVVKTINCDEHCMEIGAHFVTHSIPQLGLDPHKPDPHYRLAGMTIVAQFPLKTSTYKQLLQTFCRNKAFIVNVIY